VPQGLLEPEQAQQFCCAGCRTVYAAIRAHGLERYYAIQQDAPDATSPANPSGRAFQELDAVEFLDAHTACVGPGLRSIDLYLQGVHCSACVWLVEKLPRVAPGVVESRLDLGRARVKITWQEDQATLSQIARTLDSLGYTPHVGRDGKDRELRLREDRQLLVKIAVAGAGAGNVMLLAFALYGGSFHGMEHEYSSLFRWLSLVIGLVVLLGPGALFFRGAIAALRTRTAHLDLPIALGLGAGAIAGTVNTWLGRGEIYFDSLTGLVFLLLVGRYVQRRLERRAADSVERLFSLTPAFAHLREGEQTRDVSIDALELAQHVEVRPGESFPADGVVVDGESSVDISLLTGESRPVAVAAEGIVFAGAVNLQRPLVVQVVALGRETRVGKLLTLMDECARRKAPIVQLADRVAGYFTVAALVLFAATFVAWRFIDARHALDHAVSLLIVSCPCGLGLATPFAVAVSLGRAARASILVKGGEVLEKLSKSRPVAPLVYLDKTGTLTESGLKLLEWHGDAALGRTLAPAIVQLESQVSHPVAHALAALDDWQTVLGYAGSADPLPAATREATARFANEDSRPRVELLETTRAGVVGLFNGQTLRIGSEQFALASRADSEKKPPHSSVGALSVATARESSQTLAQRCLTPVWLALEGSIVAVAGVGSPVRPDAAGTITALRNRGLEVQLLSGDDMDTVVAVGRELGVAREQCHGGLTPEDKLHWVQKAAATRPTFMVGDGVNDAAALSAATVGIAVQGGAEASLAAADVYLGRAGVGVLVELLDGASRTITTIRRALYVSLAYNLVAAALASTGFINALVAATLMPLASFSVLGIALGSKTFGVPLQLGKV
jgi:Cu2+-exporting ATPase